MVGVTVQGADTGDTASMVETLIAAAEQVESVLPDGPGIEEVVGDKGYHSNETMADLKALGLRSDISGAGPGRRCWKQQQAARDAVYANRRRIRGERGRRAPAVSRGGAGAAVCARVRDGRDATGPSSRTSKHLKTAPRARRRPQPRAAAASDYGRGHAPEPSGPARGPLSSRVPAISRPVGRSEAFLGALHADFVVDDLSTAR